MIAADSTFVFRNMAEASDLLEWPKKDNRRFLHVVYRVGDLDRTIAYVFLFSFSKYRIQFFSVTWVFIYILRYSIFLTRFYTECFGMKLLRKRDVPEEKYSNAFLGFGPETSNFVVELTYSNALFTLPLLLYAC